MNCSRTATFLNPFFFFDSIATFSHFFYWGLLEHTPADGSGGTNDCSKSLFILRFPILPPIFCNSLLKMSPGGGLQAKFWHIFQSFSAKCTWNIAHAASLEHSLPHSLSRHRKQFLYSMCHVYTDSGSTASVFQNLATVKSLVTLSNLYTVLIVRRQAFIGH